MHYGGGNVGFDKTRRRNCRKKGKKIFCRGDQNITMVIKTILAV